MDDSTTRALRRALGRAAFLVMLSLGFGLALVPFIAGQYGESTGSARESGIERSATDDRGRK